MILSLPSHVAHTADLSARAHIPTFARVLVAFAMFVVRLDDKRRLTVNGGALSNHLRKDIGLEPELDIPNGAKIGTMRPLV